MPTGVSRSDSQGMRLGLLATVLALLGAALGGGALTPAASASTSTCGAGTHGSAGYAYAGHQADSVAHGIRARITPLVAPRVDAGHVAGWVGVGGPGQGPNGSSMWLQAGIAAIPGMPMMVYAEIARPGGEPTFMQIEHDVVPGRTMVIAVLELRSRPEHWQVWVDGRPVTEPIRLAGSANRWRPIATAESWNNGTGACNRFGFRFDDVGVARARGGSWRPLVSGYRFLDRGYVVRQLRTDGARLLSVGSGIRPYAFEAASS